MTFRTNSHSSFDFNFLLLTLWNYRPKGIIIIRSLLPGVQKIIIIITGKISMKLGRMFIV